MTQPLATLPQPHITDPGLHDLLAQTDRTAGPLGVDALIHDDRGRLFVQKRSDDRPFLPGCWDGTGGHVEAGETLLNALCREVHEETGWHLQEIKALLHQHHWTGRTGKTLTGYVFLATASGDMDTPVLEPGKVSDARWIQPADLPLLLENRPESDPGPYHAAARAGFDWLQRTEAPS
ncbi:MAG: hypothetical protein Alpg2KO_13730 [Alphaproteobacteria bacterium]